MVSQLLFIISEKNKVTEKIVKETSTHPADLVKSLQEFQQSTNVALTKVIEMSTDGGDNVELSDDEDSDSDEDEAATAKKRKK